MGKKEIKTNVMRILDKEKVPYTAEYYPHNNEAVDGASVAKLTGHDSAHVFKTLVTAGNDKEYYVFDIPVEKELDLKKAARAAGVKSLEMIHVKDINKVTGYIRGGCSPIGMKKNYKTTFHITAASIPEILVSGGRIGTQICLKPEDLIRVTNGQIADICKN